MESEFFLLQRQVSALRKEVAENKKLFKKRKIKTSNVLLLGGISSLLILIGFNFQNKNWQFNGDRLQPVFEQLLQLVATGSVAGMATNYFIKEEDG